MDGTKHNNSTGIVADRLKVERAVNSILSTANGFTRDERYEGMHVEIVRLNAGMNFVNVSAEI